MGDKLKVTVTEPQDENLEKFQKLLAYFVEHLELCNLYDKKCKEKKSLNNNKELPKAEKEALWNDTINNCKNFKHSVITGQGYNDDVIQEGIKDFCVLQNGKVCISVQYGQNASSAPYCTSTSYLHWADGLAGNVSIYTEADNGHVDKLYIEDKWNAGIYVKYSIGDLGINLYNPATNNKDIETNLQKFYEVFVKAAELETKAFLERAKNIIFTGAPGTGKTFLAKQIAELIEAETEFVQFHPSYDYTDFVEGLRPIKDNNSNIVFERKDGIFKAFCEKALKECKDAEQKNRVPKPYIFIIDEINRGEISKIFGELFFSVDPGYRGVSGVVKTQYANLQTDPNLFDLVLLALEKIQDGDWGHFFIPENVYIIGTMNDIDRSVESMDFAFRRRFTFKEITAKETQLQILNSMTNGKIVNELISRMNSLNEAISKSEEFSDAYHIGAAYFKHYEDYANQDKPFDKLWNNHIKGVLFEYLRGRPNAKEILKKWENAYNDNKKGKKQEEAQEAIAEE